MKQKIELSQKELFLLIDSTFISLVKGNWMEVDELEQMGMLEKLSDMSYELDSSVDFQQKHVAEMKKELMLKLYNLLK